jgi:hypothetical protein
VQHLADVAVGDRPDHLVPPRLLDLLHPIPSWRIRDSNPGPGAYETPALTS